MHGAIGSHRQCVHPTELLKIEQLNEYAKQPEPKKVVFSEQPKSRVVYQMNAANWLEAVEINL